MPLSCICYCPRRRFYWEARGHGGGGGGGGRLHCCWRKNAKNELDSSTAAEDWLRQKEPTQTEIAKRKDTGR